MLYFLLGLALAAAPALGQSTDVTPVALFIHFQQQPPAAVFDSIRSEVGNIMAPLGFPLEWNSLDGVRGNEVATELAVVTFRGRCDTGDLLAEAAVSSPLGITHVSDGVVIPFTEVDCVQIRTFLRRRLIATYACDRDAVFGRAVGRVLAHELFHIFAGTTHHGVGGVSKPVFTENELVSPKFQFEASEFRMVRQSLKQARLENSRLRSAPSALSGRCIFREDGCASCHGASAEGTRSAPALRATSKRLDVKTLAAKLTKDVLEMYHRAKHPQLAAPTLDADEIADIASFLSTFD